MRIKSSKKKEEFKPPYIEEKDGYLEKLQKFLNPQDDGLFMEREMKSPNFVRSKKGWMIDDQGKAYFNNVEIYSNAENAITIDYGSDILLEHGGDIKFTSVTAPTACTATLIATATGNVDAGTHKYKVTFVNEAGETELGTASNEITADATHKQVALSNIPTSSSGSVTARKIYRTKAGGGSYFLLTTISNNTTTTYTDNIADASLTGDEANFKINDTFGKIIIDDIVCATLAYNIFLGSYAGVSNTVGENNIFIGDNAGYDNISGRRNICIGFYSGYNVTEDDNTFVGSHSGYINNEGCKNTFIGSYAGFKNDDADYNVFLGSFAGYENQTGNNNVFLGYLSGFSNITGDDNVFLGYQAGYYETASNKLFIDNQPRSNEADGRVKALIYGVFNSAVASQILTINGVIKGAYGAKIGDGGTTNYTEIKNDGEINLHGTARVTRHLRVGAGQWKHGASAPAAGFEGIFPTLDFDAVSDDEAHYTVIVPHRLDLTVDIEFVVDWFYDGAQDNGTVCWAVEYKSIEAGEAVTGAGTTITKVSAGTHTTGQMVRTTFTTKILASNLEACDTFALRLYRDVSADTLAVDARLLSTHFHFCQSKLGKSCE